MKNTSIKRTVAAISLTHWFNTCKHSSLLSHQVKKETQEVIPSTFKISSCFVSTNKEDDYCSVTIVLDVDESITPEVLYHIGIDLRNVLTLKYKMRRLQIITHLKEVQFGHLFIDPCKNGPRGYRWISGGVYNATGSGAKGVDSWKTFLEEFIIQYDYCVGCWNSRVSVKVAKVVND